MVNLLELPDETLLQILEYFRLDDIKNIRLTNKRLYLLSLDKAITKKECLLVNERIFKRNGGAVVRALMTSNRNFEIFVFKNDNYYFEVQLPEDLLVNVIAKFGEGVRQVYYQKTNIEFSRSFKHVIDFCPNLELISIKDCNDLFMQETFCFSDVKLLRMKTLKIQETQYLTDLILCRLFALCPNLEEITLSSCGMNMHNGVYGKFYRQEPSEVPQPSDDVFNFKFLFHLLRGLNKITELNLSFSNLTHESVTQIFLLPNVKLTKLNLMGCREISWPRLLANNAFASQTAITYLNLSHSTLFNDNMLIYMCTNLVNLEYLYLGNCFSLTDYGFSQINQLHRLKELNINNNHELTGNIMANLRECKLQTLKALHTALDTDQIIRHLTKLNLTRCEIGFILKATLFNDDAIKAINRSQLELRELHIHSLTISDQAFIGDIGDNVDTDAANRETLFMNTLNTTLEEYKLHEDLPRFRSIFHYEANLAETSISNLRHIQVLNLDCCQRITDEAFRLSMDLPFLRKISLSSTKVTFTGICFLVQKSPELESIDLENTLINDAAVCIMVQALPKLTHLSLKNCSKLTSLSYKLIAKHCLKLKALHGWNALTRDDMYDVNSTLTTIFNLPNMSKLYATRCMLIQDENITLLPYANHPFYEQIVYE